jgi:pSer/pThr/pTyr-binding forkhead associated (FHA) protein
VSEQLLTILKLCLLALLYLFFLRVLRAVWVEINGPKREARPARQSKAERRKVVQLTVVEPPQLRGRTYSLNDEVTMGRAAGCQVVLDDTYASQIHARLFARDGQYFVEDLGSTNGTYLNRRKVSGPMVMQRGDRIRIGGTEMELA